MTSNKHSMKRMILGIALIAISLSIKGTTLNKADIIVIGFNMTNNSQNWITLMARNTVPSGTVISITNDRYMSYANSSASFTAHTSGTKKLKITLTEPLMAGQTFKVFRNGTTCWSTHGNSQATGVIDLGNADDILVLWVYQEITSGATTLNNVITGVAWDWGNGANKEIQDLHPGYDDAGAEITWTHGKTGGLNTSGNSLNLQISGNSAKCGSWNPFSSGTAYKAAITLTANITSSGSFYDKSGWNIGTSAGWNSCSLTEVDANVINGYLATNFNTTIVYKKTCSGWERSTNGGSSFSAEPGITGDWPTNADVSSSEVRIECDHSLVATNYKTYECYKLVVGNGASKVTLTVNPGNNLYFSQSLSFILSANNARPQILLRSGDVSGTVMYSTIVPSSAPFNDLDGDMSYELYIKHAGWHHLMSPISSLLQDVQIQTNVNGTPTNVSGTSFFTSNSLSQYTTSRVWSWNGTSQQWVNEAGNAALANFSSQPYTIFIHPNEIPLTLTVTGLVPTNRRDQTNLTNLTASSATSSVGLGNVPWVRTGVTLQGNNFYGNPFLSFIDSRALLENYTNSGSSTSNRMSNLNDYILVWDPSTGTSANGYNVSTQYLELSCSLSGGVYSFTTNSTKTSFLSPFQAFVMKSSNGGSNGFVESRRYRIGSSLNTTTNTVVNKSGTINNQKTLRIYNQDGYSISSVNVGAYFNTDRRYKEHSDIRARLNGHGYFGAYVDSMLLSSVFWPTQDDSSSIDVLFSSENNGQVFKLQTDAQEGFVFDHRDRVLHNLNNGDYFFTHDTLWNNVPRFKWYFNNQVLLSSLELGSQHELIAYYGNGVVHMISSLDGNGQVYNSTGQLVRNISFTNGYSSINAHNLESGIYVVISQGLTTKFIIK